MLAAVGGESDEGEDAVEGSGLAPSGMTTAGLDSGRGHDGVDPRRVARVSPDAGHEWGVGPAAMDEIRRLYGVLSP
jgi:hypothetical protein